MLAAAAAAATAATLLAVFVLAAATAHAAAHGYKRHKAKGDRLEDVPRDEQNKKDIVPLIIVVVVAVGVAAAQRGAWQRNTAK